MKQTWRTALKNYLQEYYVQGPEEWSDMIISTSGVLNITIVSKRFSEPLARRREQIQELMQSFEVPVSLGYLGLYTPEEAAALELSRPPDTEENPLYSWFDLATRAANVPEAQKSLRRKPRIPVTVTFYSFKGGVGRTTALVQTATILARRGRKVVIVDLDLEAPGLSSALAMKPLQHGIVDYFYERSYAPKEVDLTISVADIFSEVYITNATGRLFVVPAGQLDLDYIAKVDDLRANAITERGEDLWSTFYRDITEQLAPDVILVDSRTGLNEWGAFSLLRVADKAIIFLYPNDQNCNGIDLITKTISAIVPTYFVFSPVPAVGEIGTEMVKKQWELLQTIEEEEEEETVGEDLQNEELLNEVADPIVIPYLTGIALADSYPVEELSSYYTRIANIIEEDTNAARVETLLMDTSSRRRIIESLEFPQVDAMQNQNLEVFQRTADFDRFLDGTTCLICGKKGTGKTELYKLLLKYSEEARRLSRKRLDSVTCISGHGSFRKHPDKDEFQQIGRSIVHAGTSWEAFWRAYLFLRLRQEDQLQTLLKNNKDSKFQKLRSSLQRVPKGVDDWRKEYTDLLIEMATDVELNLLLKDALDVINSQLTKSTQREVLWFLYDDLDVDFREENELRSSALTGLFQLVQACDVRQLKSIGFKIFLREDIWRRLIFDNKSHFNGRDIVLRWTRADFLKLALRQAQQSREFSDLVERFSPVENIDQADEESVERALQLLWGSRRERNPKSKQMSRWVYERLTDSSGTTFPRSLSILLKTAKEYELTAYRGQQSMMDARLLRPQSLIQGLKEASEKRCDELRNEYAELIPFFDTLVGFNIVTEKKELESVWQKTVEARLPEFKDFEKFVEFLLTIGLIGLAKRRQEQGYRFAEIYTHGFRINRGTRKY